MRTEGCSCVMASRPRATCIAWICSVSDVYPVRAWLALTLTLNLRRGNHVGSGWKNTPVGERWRAATKAAPSPWGEHVFSVASVPACCLLARLNKCSVHPQGILPMRHRRIRFIRHRLLAGVFVSGCGGLARNSVFTTSASGCSISQFHNVPIRVNRR